MTPLESLQFHWGTAYAIWHSAPTASESHDMWMAQRRGDRHTLLVAMSADELRQMIRADYRPTKASESR